MLSTMDGSMFDQVVVGGSASLVNLVIHAVLVGVIIATVRRLRMEGGSVPSFLRYTLVIVATGTLLVVTESGFEAVPAVRRDEAFRMNDGGWAAQVKNIARHVSENP